MTTPKKDLFGNGTASCSVCGSDIRVFRAIKINIAHKEKPDDSVCELKYFLPFCDKHNGAVINDGGQFVSNKEILDIQISFESTPVQLSETIEIQTN